jgi:acyl-CoA thioesterase I
MYSFVRPRATIISLKKALPAVVMIALAACGGEQRDVVRQAPQEGSASSSLPDTRDAVVVIGTSLTAGFGLADPEMGYPGGLQSRIDAEGLSFRVVNAGVSGDTSRGGLERIDWVLRAKPRVLVIELGANDGLRGIDPSSMEENLQAIIDRARRQREDVAIVLVGMQAPPNLGSTYGERFNSVFPRLAERNGAGLVPFLLKGVGGIRELNQADGIHPTLEGHKILAENVWETLGPLLRELGR